MLLASDSNSQETICRRFVLNLNAANYVWQAVTSKLERNFLTAAALVTIKATRDQQKAPKVMQRPCSQAPGHQEKLICSALVCG